MQISSRVGIDRRAALSGSQTARSPPGKSASASFARTGAESGTSGITHNDKRPRRWRPVGAFPSPTFHRAGRRVSRQRLSR